MHVDPDGFFELTYCTNIHPGETLDEVDRNLKSYTIPLRERVAPGRNFGVGLRLSDQAARTLEEPERLDRFKDHLDRNGLYVFTLNGFPYGGFHRQTVKDQVYVPDWRRPERLDYTHRLIRILAELLPRGSEGSISTSPLSYKPWLGKDERREALRVGARNLAAVAAALHDLREQSGKLIHIGIEPEPDCLIANSRETVDFFKEWLLRAGVEFLEREHGMSAQRAEEALVEHVRVCYDTCHFAVEFESPGLVLSRFEQAGIRLSKVQISAALRVVLDGSVDRDELRHDLEPFAESTYLHQVVAKAEDGHLSRYPDLPEALPHLATSEADEWRIHYHVPIFVERYERLHSTQRDIISAIEHILRTHATPHLEIETYTWDVLPQGLKTDVLTSLEREYGWLIGRLALAPVR